MTNNQQSPFLETLKRADLDSYYPNLTCYGINSIESLCEMSMQDYGIVGIHNMEDRKRLFQLIQSLQQQQQQQQKGMKSNTRYENLSPIVGLNKRSIDFQGLKSPLLKEQNNRNTIRNSLGNDSITSGSDESFVSAGTPTHPHIDFEDFNIVKDQNLSEQLLSPSIGKEFTDRRLSRGKTSTTSHDIVRNNSRNSSRSSFGVISNGSSSASSINNNNSVGISRKNSLGVDVNLGSPSIRKRDHLTSNATIGGTTRTSLTAQLGRLKRAASANQESNSVSNNVQIVASKRNLNAYGVPSESNVSQVTQPPQAPQITQVPTNNTNISSLSPTTPALTVVDRIRVCVRKRPMSKKELARNDSDIIEVGGQNTIFINEPKVKLDLTRYIEKHEFIFDDAFDSDCTNDEVYQRTALPLVKYIFDGGKATCFAYGQTGSGKTFTMLDEKDGLYVKAGRDIFDMLQWDEYQHLSAWVSFYEIYQGNLYDLLNSRKKLFAREDGKQQVQISGLQEHKVDGVDLLMQIFEYGNNARSTGATGANSDSSRSHAILQIVLKNENGKQRGKFSFIDLAGSERGADRGETDRQTRMEGSEINKSLLALKECIRALDQVSRHTPFRQSKLTQVLKDSFIGNSKTCMIATISPSSTNSEHTLNTLRYADRVKELKSEAREQAANSNNIISNNVTDAVDSTTFGNSNNSEKPTSKPMSLQQHLQMKKRQQEQQGKTTIPQSPVINRSQNDEESMVIEESAAQRNSSITRRKSITKNATPKRKTSIGGVLSYDQDDDRRSQESIERPTSVTNKLYNSIDDKIITRSQAVATPRLNTKSADSMNLASPRVTRRTSTPQKSASSFNVPAYEYKQVEANNNISTNSSPQSVLSDRNTNDDISCNNGNDNTLSRLPALVGKKPPTSIIGSATKRSTSLTNTLNTRKRSISKSRIDDNFPMDIENAENINYNNNSNNNEKYYKNELQNQSKIVPVIRKEDNELIIKDNISKQMSDKLIQQHRTHMRLMTEMNRDESKLMVAYMKHPNDNRELQKYVDELDHVVERRLHSLIDLRNTLKEMVEM